MGLNTFITLPVPAFNGDGIIVDVSGVTAEKTIYLAGQYLGEYIILGSQDDVRFVAIARFESNGNSKGGPQTVKRDVMASLKSMRVRRSADQSVNVSVASEAICPCS